MFGLKPKNEAAIQQERMFRQEMNFNRQQDALQSSNYGDDLYMQRKEVTNDLTRWQQDLQDEEERLIRYVNREFLNANNEWERMTEPTGEYESVQGKNLPVHRYMIPMMNEQGVSMIRTVLMPLTSRNLMMSNYKEEQIYVKLRNIVFTFINHLALHYDTYDIRKEDLPVILRMFKDTIEPAHWRSLQQGERHFLNTIQKRVEAISTSAQPEKKSRGLLDGLMGG